MLLECNVQVLVVIFCSNCFSVLFRFCIKLLYGGKSNSKLIILVALKIQGDFVHWDAMECSDWSLESNVQVANIFKSFGSFTFMTTVFSCQFI